MDRIYYMVKTMKDVILLKEWEIQVEELVNEPENKGRVVDILYEYKHACIGFNKNALDINDIENIFSTVVHELCHIYTSSDVIPLLSDDYVTKVYWDKMLFVNECITSDLARTFYDIFFKQITEDKKWLRQWKQLWKNGK